MCLCVRVSIRTLFHLFKRFWKQLIQVGQIKESFSTRDTVNQCCLLILNEDDTIIMLHRVACWKTPKEACVQDYMYLFGRGARNVTDFAIKSSHRRVCTANGPAAVKLDVRLGDWASAK